jgi:hypothetical protein
LDKDKLENQAFVRLSKICAVANKLSLPPHIRSGSIGNKFFKDGNDDGGGGVSYGVASLRARFPDLGGSGC